MDLKIVVVKLPCGRELTVELAHDINLIEEDKRVFMLIDGKIIKDKIEE